jgi:hypothetical protein
MSTDTLPLILQVPLVILGAALCVFMFIGFWRGLSLRPHEPEHRPAPPRWLWYWWWWTGV